MNLAYARVLDGQLRESVVGKTIRQVVANQNPHSFVWFALEPERAFRDDKAAPETAAYLTGKTISRSDVQMGGYGLFNFLYVGERALMSDIVPRYFLPAEKLPKKHQLLIIFEDGSALCYTASLGGALFLLRVDENGLPERYSNPFPPLLSDAFSYAFFQELIRRLSGKTVSVKQLLATKNRIPGIDNGLLQDILWEARVNPKSKVDALDEDDFQRIFRAVKTVIPAIIAGGGKDTDKDLYGHFGGYAARASRNTAGKPCARCGEAIVKEAYLGGSVFYCPSCQKEKRRSSAALAASV